MNKIRFFRLNTGDDIIAEVIPTRARSRSTFIKDPMRVITDYDPKEKMHKTFLIRWNPYTHERIHKLPNKDILCSNEPILELQDHYFDVCDETWDVEDPEDPAFLARQERRIEIKLMLDRPTRDEEIN